MRMIVTGGGTGGHIYPAVSIAEAFKKKNKNTKLLYVGRKQGLESELVPKLGIEFRPISIEYKKRGLAGLIKHVGSLISSIFEARRIIKDYKPDIIVGTGAMSPVLLCLLVRSWALKQLSMKPMPFLDVPIKC